MKTFQRQECWGYQGLVRYPPVKGWGRFANTPEKVTPGINPLKPRGVGLLLWSLPNGGQFSGPWGYRARNFINPRLGKYKKRGFFGTNDMFPYLGKNSPRRLILNKNPPFFWGGERFLPGNKEAPNTPRAAHLYPLFKRTHYVGLCPKDSTKLFSGG